MPVINAAFYKGVSGAGALVLLGEDAKELDTAESSLLTAQVPFKESKRSEFVGKELSLYVAILFPKITANGRFLSLDTAVRAFNAASLESIVRISVSLDTGPWSYVARMPLLVDSIHGGGWVAADIQVARGTVGVGVLNRKGDAFLTSGSAGATEKPQTILLWVDLFCSAGDLVLRNWTRNPPQKACLERFSSMPRMVHTAPMIRMRPARAFANALRAKPRGYGAYRYCVYSHGEHADWDINAFGSGDVRFDGKLETTPSGATLPLDSNQRRLQSWAKLANNRGRCP